MSAEIATAPESRWDPNELVEPVGYPDGLAAGEPLCPTCGPTATEQHPQKPGVIRCANCKEHLMGAASQEFENWQRENRLGRFAPEPRGEDWHRGDWMQTFTGKRFFPMDPRAEEIDPVDVAHALSLACRFGGHVSRFYSVAEHCVTMAQFAIDRGDPPEVVRWALLHDASEAYVGDMVRPLKLQMPAYVEAEDRVIAAIAERFQVPLPMPKAVKELDNRILLDERREFLGAPAAAWSQDHLEPLGVRLHGWMPDVAEASYTALLWEVIA